MRFVLLTIGFIGAGLLGAVFGQVLFPPGEALPPRSEEYSRLTAQVDDLAAEVESLRNELREERASRPLPATARSPAPAPGAPAMPGTDVAEGEPAGSAALGFVPDEVIEEKVRETVNEIAREQREERARQAEAEAVAKETAWLKEMQPDIGMTDYQVEELGKLLAERRRTMGAFQAKKAALGANITPQDAAALQQAIADYGTNLKNEVLKVVSIDQYDAIVRWSEEKRKRDASRNR